MKQFSPADSERQQTRQTQSAAEMGSAEKSQSFVDNRPEALAQRKLRETINASPKMLSQRKLVEAMNNSPRVAAQRKLHALMNGSTRQLQAAPEEELLQGKFEAVQRIEEEEPLQGKFATAQRVEEEELVQGKFETVQRVEEEEHLQGKFDAVQRVEEEEPLQGKFAHQSPVQREPQPATKPNNTGLPDNLKSGIESLSGMSMDNVRVHYSSSQPAQLNALAYAQGTDIHVAPGQEQHLPHEAWHVVQQAQGRVKPTMQMKDGVSINDNKGLEHEADVMGAKAMQMKQGQNTGHALVSHVSTVQLKDDANAHSKGCNCPSCCAPAQLRGASVEGTSAPQLQRVMQLKTSIQISDNFGNTAKGYSGSQDFTSIRMSKWPEIESLIKKHVTSESVPEREDGEPTDKTYTREWNFCAEPHAFANLLGQFDSKDQKTVNRNWLNGLRFKERAVDEKGNSLKPCSVCSQWVTQGDPPLSVKDNIKPNDPIKNKAQIDHEKQEKQEKQEQQRAEQDKTEFATNIDKLSQNESILLGDAKEIKEGLERKLVYYQNLKKNKGKNLEITEDQTQEIHKKAWTGIVYKENAPEFVEAVKDLLVIIERNCFYDKGIRSSDPQLITHDTQAIAAMESYYKRCEEKMKQNDDGSVKEPNQKLIINLIAEIKATNNPDSIEGEIKNLKPSVRKLKVPDDCAKSKIGDLVLTFGENGELTILDASTGTVWESPFED